MDYIFFGIQGSGKGTQTKLLSEKFGFPRFETGGELRRIAQTDTELGHKVKTIIENGLLVSQEIVIDLVEEFIKDHQGASSILFDGIPRNDDQYPAFHNILKKYGRDYKTVHIVLTEDSARERLLKRAEIENRTDDTLEGINKRIQIFFDDTKPLLKHYLENGKLVEIDGEPDVESIHQSIITKLNLS